MAKLKIRRNPTRRYEAVYIFDSALDDAVITEKLEKLQGLLSLTEAAELEMWGRRALAYKIGRHENGYYIISKFHAEPKVLPEMSVRSAGDGDRYLGRSEHEMGAQFSPMKSRRPAARRMTCDDDRINMHDEKPCPITNWLAS